LPGFLVSAASHAPQIALSVILGLATGAISVGIAITAFPHFQQRSQAMALWAGVDNHQAPSNARWPSLSRLNSGLGISFMGAPAELRRKVPPCCQDD
jgi:hypothetical protein